MDDVHRIKQHKGAISSTKPRHCIDS